MGSGPTKRESRRRDFRGSALAGCPVSDLFRLLGKPYMLDILSLMMGDGPSSKRFVEIQSALRISPNTLSDRLRELVQAGLLTRTAYSEIPPRVDYAITNKARELRPVFETLDRWASAHDLKPTAPASAATA